jgi:hypothetical protein
MLSRFDMGRHCRKDVNRELEIICYTFYDRRHITILKTKCLVKRLGVQITLYKTRVRERSTSGLEYGPAAHDSDMSAYARGEAMMIETAYKFGVCLLPKPLTPGFER